MFELRHDLTLAADKVISRDAKQSPARQHESIAPPKVAPPSIDARVKRPTIRLDCEPVFRIRKVDLRDEILAADDSVLRTRRRKPVLFQ